MYSLDEPLFVDVLLACVVALIVLVVLLALFALWAVECAGAERKQQTPPTPVQDTPANGVRKHKKHHKRRYYAKCRVSPDGKCCAEWRRGRLCCVYCAMVYR